VSVPDELRLLRYRTCPELGPRLLFFSGGTALNALSRRLTEYTHNSIHIVTPFDSGGSSRKLRQAFSMPSVGDMRSRLMALADRSVKGNPEIYDLFAYRLPKDADPPELGARLRAMVEGTDDLVRRVPDPMRKIIRSHLRYFMERMPAAFDLRGASIGNLILVGGYLFSRRHIDPVAFMFSKLVEARGTVRMVTGESLHLMARLEDGTTIRGQRDLAGKEVPPIEAAVEDIYMSKEPDSGQPVEVTVREKVEELIAEAELICFPMGSFYSSIVANLLPRGVTRAVRDNRCPKVYVPNTGVDPEQRGMTVYQCVRRLVSRLDGDGGGAAGDRCPLDLVVLDSDDKNYGAEADVKKIESLGVGVLRTGLVTGDEGPDIDPERLLGVLLSLT
jgi:CofD-related protein of GAK system